MRCRVLGLSLLFLASALPAQGPSYSGHGADSVPAAVVAKHAPPPLDRSLTRRIEAMLDVRAPGMGILAPDGRTLYFGWTITGTAQVFRLDGPERVPAAADRRRRPHGDPRRHAGRPVARAAARRRRQRGRGALRAAGRRRPAHGRAERAARARPVSCSRATMAARSTTRPTTSRRTASPSTATTSAAGRGRPSLPTRACGPSPTAWATAMRCGCCW